MAAGLAAGSVVSVFCSHAARSAALARIQMYFFIVLIREPYCFNRLIGARRFLTALECHSERSREWRGRAAATWMGRPQAERTGSERIKSRGITQDFSSGFLDFASLRLGRP